MTDRAMRFRIGVFVLAALILLALLITLFGSFPRFFRSQNEYIVQFQDAPGLAEGTPVRRSGVRIGEVSRIELDDENGTVLVHIRIDKGYRLRRLDIPTIVTGLLGGDTSIDFVPKKEGTDRDFGFVQPGEVLIGARLADVSTLLAQASQVVPTTQEALDQMRKSLQRFEKMVPPTEDAIKEYTKLGQSLNKTIPDIEKTNQQLLETAREIEVTARNWSRLGENVNNLVVTQQEKVIKTLDNLNDTIQRVGSVLNDENQRNVSGIIRNMRTTSDSLDELMRNTNELIKDSQKTVKTVGDSVSKADEALQNLTKATKPFADRGDTIARSLDETSDRLNKTLTDVQAIFRVIGEKDGTFNRLISDPSLYNNIDTAVLHLTHLMTRFDHILKDMEVFADKLARHPELLGIGGVVRPSAGLKDAPTNVSMYPHLPGH
jgi:phospholipid/cholesterol/gamma-HCH transport system substrate-binding protein